MEGDELAGGTTSLFNDLTTRPPDFVWWSGELAGCTVLTIISQNAMYMAHFWQDKAFDLDEGANPEHYITQFLATGRNPETDPNGPELDCLDKLQGLAPLANHFINAPGLRVMILTPGSESHAPVPEYPAIIGAMEAQVRLILGGFTGDVDHIYYEPPNKDQGSAELDRLVGGIVQYTNSNGQKSINVAMAYQNLPSLTWS